MIRSVALFISALILGATLGTIYGLMAFGMVAAYRISGVVNLGQAGIAAVCAALYWWMETVRGAPRPLAVPLAILAGGVLGATLGYLTLRLSSWPKGLVMILTLAATLLLRSTWAAGAGTSPTCRPDGWARCSAAP